MQMDSAIALNKRWKGKSCEHPHLEKEYHLGSQTGDYVCTTCGEAFSNRSYARQETNNKFLKQEED